MWLQLAHSRAVQDNFTTVCAEQFASCVQEMPCVLACNVHLNDKSGEETDRHVLPSCITCRQPSEQQLILQYHLGWIRRVSDQGLHRLCSIQEGLTWAMHLVRHWNMW